jgi:hypothetical protein
MVLRSRSRICAAASSARAVQLVNLGQPVIQSTPVLAAGFHVVARFLTFKESAGRSDLYAGPTTHHVSALPLTSAWSSWHGDGQRHKPVVTGFATRSLRSASPPARARRLPPDSLVESSRRRPRFHGPGPWRRWRLGAGVYLHFSAPQRSFWWVLFVLLTMFTVQQATAPCLAPRSARLRHGRDAARLSDPDAFGPPAMVTFLPSFGRRPGLARTAQRHAPAQRPRRGIDATVTAVFGIASIALGTLIGASI